MLRMVGLWWAMMPDFVLISLPIFLLFLFLLFLLLLLLFLFFFLLPLLFDRLGLAWGVVHVLLTRSVIKVMNFETNETFEELLGRLLALVIMFEKKIEELRKKLAGNEEFHTRLVFQKLDARRRGEVKPEDMSQMLVTEGSTISIAACQAFCRKYTISGAISYDQMLDLISPKTDKTLAQRLLVRTAKRGATLPAYLWRFTCELFNSMILMTVLTEETRKKIQNSSQLNHLEMLEFFQKCLTTHDRIWRFCNGNSQEEYDFSVSDVRFLTSHVRSGNPVHEFTEEDIKQILCPLDMNFQKTVNEMGAYFDNLKQQKLKTVNGFYRPTRPEQAASNATKINFLGLTYQRAFYPKREQPENDMNSYNAPPPARQISYPREQIYLHQDPNDSIRIREPAIGRNYLDNFIKPSNMSSSRGIELDKFLSGRNRRQEFERFEDNLPDNYSSSDVDQSGSAFVEY